jgi:proteasome beta subunit
MPLKEELSKSVEVRKTGTTTMGIICRDGAVLAAESKSTMGYLIASKESEKILQLEDHIAMTIAGASGDAESLARYMKAELKLLSIENQRKISVKGAATLLANILQGSKYYPYYVQLIIGGYDSSGARIFTLDPLGSVEEEKKFFSTGSGSPMALGVLEDAYKEGMTVDEASKLAMRAVKSAIERDIGSGGKVMDIAVITKDGVKITRYDLDKLPK